MEMGSLLTASLATPSPYDDAHAGSLLGDLGITAETVGSNVFVALVAGMMDDYRLDDGDQELVAGAARVAMHASAAHAQGIADTFGGLVDRYCHGLADGLLEGAAQSQGTHLLDAVGREAAEAARAATDTSNP